MPREIAGRSNDYALRPLNEEYGRASWLGAWNDLFVKLRTLSKFNHNNIVRVHTVFEANNTAFMVMSYEQGISFHEKLLRDGQPTEDELRDLMLGFTGWNGSLCMRPVSFTGI